MEDRRLFARIKMKFPLKFLSPRNGGKGVAETLDISANGLGLVTKEELSRGDLLELWIQIPDHHQPLYTQGEVVWKDSVDGSGTRRMGVRLSRCELMGLARVLWLDNKA